MREKARERERVCVHVCMHIYVKLLYVCMYECVSACMCKGMSFFRVLCVYVFVVSEKKKKAWVRLSLSGRRYRVAFFSLMPNCFAQQLAVSSFSL